jgi:hypothetical protein
VFSNPFEPFELGPPQTWPVLNTEGFLKTKQENIMIKNEKTRIWVNRIASLVIAGGLMFLVMNFGVTDKLRKELDASKYESTELLNDAQAFYENENYDRAKETLTTLFEKRPGSNEAVEGKKLYTQMETMQNELDAKWESAVGGIREEWAIAMAAKLREAHMKEGEKLEADMENLLNNEWEDVKGTMRQEFENEE